ncbi:MAG: cytochrome P450 [Erythrobacteraceae bacterium]|jgi:cytochrome P450|nr:cytochrome P450 [Erythrobacteraceae bacterium]
MATVAPERPQVRTSPTAYEALHAHLEKHPEIKKEHTHKWDVSRSDIYFEDTWQPIFKEMQDAGPLHYIPESPYGPYWAVVGHKAIQHIEALPETFSSSWEHGGITILERREEDVEENGAMRELPMFIAMDRPEHTGQRRTVAPKFTPSGMAEMEGEIRQRTGELLDSLPRGEVFDWVDKVSIELTTGMLALLFGFPWEDRRLLTYWSDWSGDTELAGIPELEDVRWEIFHEMAAYFQSLWVERTHDKEPGDDLISMMIHSPAMNQMRPEEFIGNLVLLIVGGNDTTRNSMSGFVHALDKFPDQRKLFEENPEIIPNAVQEMLRMQTPLAHMRRTCTEDTEVFGQTIKKGDKVVLWYLAANHEEEIFPNPHKLDLTRENARRHIAFGYGIHRCVGARLAELQLRVLLEEMHKRRMRVHVAGDVERVRANFVHGFRKLEVEITEF